MMVRLLAFVLLVLGFAHSTLGQITALSDEKKIDPVQDQIAALTEQVQADTAGLQLAENHAYVNARVGAIICKSDKKAAAALFQSAVGDIVNAQLAIESEIKHRPSLNGIQSRISMSIRPAVLISIAGCDAGFALESLYRTRSPAIQRAIAQSADPSGRIFDTGNTGRAYARAELDLEQKLTALAAEQNPELAIKMLQESIRKGLSPSTLGLVKKLFEKDPESAATVATDVMDRLLGSAFTSDPTDGDMQSLALNILNDYIRPKKPSVKEFKFDDGPIRSLAQKLINSWLAPDPRFGAQRYRMLIPIAEKLSPGSVAALKKLQKSGPNYGASNLSDPDVRKVLEAKTPAAMVSDARSLSPELRPMVYRKAAARMAQTGDISGANELLRTNFAGAALENAVDQVNAAYASYMMSQGKFQEAEQFIDEFPDSTRRQSLLSLAAVAFRKSPADNKTFAINVLRKVRGQMPTRPSDGSELSQFLQLTIAFIPIEPDEAFGTIEPLIGQLNELADATAIVQGFQFVNNVRSGEFVIGVSPSYGFQMEPSVLRSLAKADFDRTQKLIDSFARREIRITYRLQLAESGLKATTGERPLTPAPYTTF